VCTHKIFKNVIINLYGSNSIYNEKRKVLLLENTERRRLSKEKTVHVQRLTLETIAVTLVFNTSIVLVFVNLHRRWRPTIHRVLYTKGKTVLLFEPIIQLKMSISIGRSSLRVPKDQCTYLGGSCANDRDCLVFEF